MINDYKNLIDNYKENLFNFTKYSFFESAYRIFGILIFPIMKYLNPNIISISSLSMSIIAFSISIISNSIALSYIILFFVISFILDFTDGMVARFHKKTSFNGRFIDGLFDIIVFGLLHIILFETIFQKEINFFYSYFYLVTILIYPVQHLIMDRYSAIARWINEIQGKKIKQAYYRNSFFGKTTMVLYDIQHLGLWLLLMNIFNYHLIIEIFFLASFIASIISISIYLYLSKKNFSSENNELDNEE